MSDNIINNINKKIIEALNEKELSILMNKYKKNNLEDLKTEIFNRTINKRCEELYDNITYGEEICTDLLKSKNNINHINDYFIKIYKTTPLLLAIRHSYSLSNVKYIKFLLEKKIYFDLNYRNESNNSLFDLLPYLYKNLKKYNDYLNVYQLKSYLDEIYDLFFRNRYELGISNTEGNTIYMNVLLSNIETYQRFMFKKLFYLTINTDTSLIKKSLNLEQINNNNETFLELFAKNSFKYHFKYDFFEYILRNDILDILNLLRIDKDGKTIITHFIENKEIDVAITICQKINNFFLELKSKINIPDNSGYTPLMYALQCEEYVYGYRYKLWKFIKLIDNLNYVNDKKESAFYFACKHGYMDIVIYIYRNDLRNTDIYPDNEPSSLYYLIQNEFIPEKCKSFNDGIKNELTEKKDRDQLNDFLIYGKNKKLFLEKSEKYDIQSILDTYRINIMKMKKNEAIYQLYYVLHKKIFKMRYKKMLLNNDILLPEMYENMFKLLFPVSKYSNLDKIQKLNIIYY